MDSQTNCEKCSCRYHAHGHRCRDCERAVRAGADGMTIIEKYVERGGPATGGSYMEQSGTVSIAGASDYELHVDGSEASKIEWRRRFERDDTYAKKSWALAMHKQAWR